MDVVWWLESIYPQEPACCVSWDVELVVVRAVPLERGGKALGLVLLERPLLTSISLADRTLP
jgi:hypothetical protein